MRLFRCGARARLVVAVVVAVLSACGVFALPASASVDITGNWQCCGDGGATAHTMKITAGTESSQGSAVSTDGTVFATISGQLNGNSATIVETSTIDVGYVATFTGTVSSDGLSMSGGWVSNHSQSGTWSATRTERPRAPR